MTTIPNDKFILKPNFYAQSPHRRPFENYYRHIMYSHTGTYWIRNDENDKTLNDYLEKVNGVKDSRVRKYQIEQFKKQLSISDIQFEMKPWLMCFNDVVYDLKTNAFRNYLPDDYVITTTNYNWKEPTQEELNYMNDLLLKTFPNRNDLVTLAITIVMRPNKVIQFKNGDGAESPTGKSIIVRFMMAALGNYIDLEAAGYTMSRISSKYRIVNEPDGHYDRNKYDNIRQMCEYVVSNDVKSDIVINFNTSFTFDNDAEYKGKFKMLADRTIHDKIESHKFAFMKIILDIAKVFKYEDLETEFKGEKVINYFNGTQ